MEINLYLKEETSKGFNFLTNLKFEVDKEKAVMAISEYPIRELYPEFEKAIMFVDGDILQAYLRFCGVLFTDYYTAFLLSLKNIETIITQWNSIFCNKLLPMDGSQGIKLIEFTKSSTLPNAFQYVEGQSIIIGKKISHPDGHVAVFSIDTIHLDTIKNRIDKKGSMLFYWNSLVNYTQGNTLNAYLIAITKCIAETYPELSVGAIITRFKYNDRISALLDGSEGIKLISFTQGKMYTGFNEGPTAFKFQVQEL